MMPLNNIVKTLLQNCGDTQRGQNENRVSLSSVFYSLTAAKSSAVCCTSRHDLSHILHCKDRQFLFRVHTDHTVAQPPHRQHRLPWRRNTHFWRSAGQRRCYIFYFCYYSYTYIIIYTIYLLLNTMKHMERLL